MIHATRTRKARRNSPCPLCQARITVGQQIAQLGKTWVHSTCAAARRRTTEGDNRP